MTLTGLVKTKHSWTWGKEIGTLPKGCRPSSALIFTANNHAGQTRINVYTDGTIRFGNAGSTNHGWVSLSGFSFATDGLKYVTLGGKWSHYSGYGGYWASARYACALAGITVVKRFASKQRRFEQVEVSQRSGDALRAVAAEPAASESASVSTTEPTSEPTSEPASEPASAPAASEPASSVEKRELNRESIGLSSTTGQVERGRSR